MRKDDIENVIKIARDLKAQGYSAKEVDAATFIAQTVTFSASEATGGRSKETYRLIKAITFILAGSITHIDATTPENERGNP